MRVGPLLTIIGIFLCLTGLVVNVVQMAGVSYPSSFWYQIYPDNNKVATGEPITLSLELVWYDMTVPIALPEDLELWQVSVEISELEETTHLATLDFGSPDSNYGPIEIEGHWCYVAVWKQPWLVPTTNASWLTFAWEVKLYESTGDLYGVQKKITYAYTEHTDVDGWTPPADEKDVSLFATPLIWLGLGTTGLGIVLTFVETRRKRK